jgi:hypothetical protein
MFTSIAPLVLIIAMFTGCNNAAKTDPKKVDTAMDVSPDSPMTTNTVSSNSKDEQGCDKAAGERWSVIKKSCIVLANAAIRLDLKDPKLDPAKPAYILFDSVRVEILLPTQDRAVIMRKTSPETDPLTWSSGPLKLVLADGMYTLDDEGKVLYQGAVR